MAAKNSQKPKIEWDDSGATEVPVSLHHIELPTTGDESKAPHFKGHERATQRPKDKKKGGGRRPPPNAPRRSGY